MDFEISAVSCTEKGRLRLHGKELPAGAAGVFRLAQHQRQTPPDWNALRRDDFRDFLRFLGRGGLSRAAVQLRFSALRSYYKFLVRNGVAAASPMRKLSLPRPEKRLPRFLTVPQLADLLETPARELKRDAKAKGKVEATMYFRDAAMLEVVYSCGLRVNELCQLRAEDVDWSGQLVRVRGKGKRSGWCLSARRRWRR